LFTTRPQTLLPPVMADLPLPPDASPLLQQVAT
jgi:hypothetical protein